MKARTVTQGFLAKIPTVEVLAALEAHRDARLKAIDAEALARKDGGKIGTVEVKPQDAALVEKWVAAKKEEVAKHFMKAQEWVNRAWGRVPAAMNAVRALSGGSVKTIDGATKPVDLAFEQVLLNRSETAAQFCRVVVRE
jgi:hypothetical protein